jgi:superfamily II DNA/RNA helicase
MSTEIFKSDNNNTLEKDEETFDSSFFMNDWDDLAEHTDLLRGIYSYGFEKPSPIQQKGIKPIMQGRDTIAQAQSGTGKTATFSIGALSLVNTSENNNQVLILSPTRELTIQTGKVITSIGSMMKDLRVSTVFGGSSTNDNSSFLKKNQSHIICGCPGRVFDMMRKETITSKKIKLVILDEADEMLSTGFKEQVYNIFQYLDANVQVALFSATLPVEIFPLINKIMRNPVKITIKTEQLTLDGITQLFIAINDDREKYMELKNIFEMISVSQTIIYCNSVKRVIDLYEAMVEDGFPVCCLHSSMSPEEREKTFHNFKSGSERVLISSNVTARGIDVQQVSIVINFDVPKDPHTYLHRIGRSGRWGRKGVGINFITRRDVQKLKEIETYYSSQIDEMPANLDFLQKL